MENSNQILQLCRLCLVKDSVNIPIFEEQGDIRQIYLKISSCLPVKVSQDDELPKKICDGCSYKLDMVYDFRNTSVNAEKQLTEWLGQANLNSESINKNKQPETTQRVKTPETFVKQEAIDPSDVQKEEEEDDKNYMFQQNFEESSAAVAAGPSATATSNEEEPPPKRAKRTAAVKASLALDQSDEDDDEDWDPITKREDESEGDSDADDNDEAPFVDVPSTSADDQPGPSGVGKDGVEAPKRIEKKSFGPVECSTCSKVFPNAYKLRRHVAAHKDKKISCDVCGKLFLYQNYMIRHKNSVHLANYTYTCDICNASFKTKLTLQQHVQNMHTKNYPHVCSKCGRGYFVQKLLEVHYRIVHEKERYVCESCGKPFKTVQGLNNHVITHDPSQKRKEYKCSLCAAIFTARSSYNLHMRKHRVGNESHVCDVCGKSVTKGVSLKHHMRTHTGEKPFKCDDCGRAFATNILLRTHIRIHTNEKPYKCEICKKGFRQRPALKIHLRYHTGEKPYFCDICSKGFVTGTLLRNHKCPGPE